MAFFNRISLADADAIVQTTYNANAAVPANTGAGGSIGAVFNAMELLVLKLQDTLEYVASIARLPTSSITNPNDPNYLQSPDVDSFINPFDVFRDEPTNVSGPYQQFTYGSPVTANSYIPFGTIVQTPEGVQFVVTYDASNANNTPFGFLTPPGGTSTVASVVALATGTSSRCGVNTVTQIVGASASGIPLPPGIISTTNTTAYTNGSDTEVDPVVMKRFTSTVSSGVDGTVIALGNAIGALEADYTYSIGSHVAPDGVTFSESNFSVILGLIGTTGHPTVDQQDAVKATMEQHRSAGDTFTVTNATTSNVTASATIFVDPSAVGGSGAVIAAATAAFEGYVNNIGLDPFGASTRCSFTSALLAVAGVPGIINIGNFQINSGTTDVSAGFGVQFNAGTVTFTAG